MTQPGKAPWHVAAADLRAYAAGTAGVAAAASVEAHVVRCGQCAAALMPAVDTGRLDTIWSAVEDTLDAPRQSRLERTLAAFGISEADARLLAATPSLRVGWFGALAAVLAVAVLFTITGGAAADGTFFLLLAPLLPVAGVAVAFGRQADPAYDVAIAAPYSSLRLLLLRSVTVLGTSVALTTLAALAMPDAAATTAWLLPALGLTIATLATATWLEPAVAATGVGGAWTFVVLEVVRRRELPALTSATAQLASLALAVAAGLVLLRRHGHFDQEGTR